MLKMLRLLSTAGMFLLLTACQPKFCTLNCGAPVETPVVSQTTVQSFADEGVVLMPKGDSLRIILPDDLFFRFGTPMLKKNKTAALDQVATLLHSYGATATVQIIGYTDPVASDERNQQLSSARARAVLAYFWSQGLDPDHLYALGYGAHNLAGDPHDVDANAANRRVEIVVHAHCTSCL